MDDASTDHTRALALEAAARHPGMRVLEAPALDLRGLRTRLYRQNQRLLVRCAQSRGRWLLFTDADTVHEPGDLQPRAA